MSLTLLLEHSLELVAERIGDPAPRVFERLFLEAPDLLALFSNDACGSVRGEMFLRALECLQDAAGAVVTGVVSGLSLVSGTPQILVNGQAYALSSVRGVTVTPTSN